MPEGDLPNASWAIHELCAHFGLSTWYYDVSGKRCEVPLDALVLLLAEFGADPAANPGDVLDSVRHTRWSHSLPPVVAFPAPQAPWKVRIRLPAAQHEIRWQLREETGAVREGVCNAHALPELERVELAEHAWCEREFSIDVRVPVGYHELSIEGLEGSALVVAAPDRCYRPDPVRNGGRVWGLAVQLYGLRSERNWGMGDLTDLLALVPIAAELGAGLIGLNPLHALFPHKPDQVSPYSPSSRLHLNVLYIDVEGVDHFEETPEARALVGSSEFQARLVELRAAPLVDAERVATAKFEVLELLYEGFIERHLTADGFRARDAAGQDFLDFIAARGTTLQRHALFEALQEHFLSQDPAVWGFPEWPEAFRRPDTPEVAAFALSHVKRLRFRQYLQWQAATQLERASKQCADQGLAVGLYLDLAVSFDRAGSDAWSASDEVAAHAAVGAPPDAFNLAGQNWGLPPLRPDRLRETRFRLFIDTLRANMRRAGAIRIDHVMGLMRLYWIPADRAAHEGGYIHYPLEEMMSVVAIESERNRCMVIGEDLGTVADEMRAALDRYDVLSYRLLYFERDGASGFSPPDRYKEAAVVAVSTHDLPPLAAWWSEADLDLRDTLGLFPDRAVLEQQRGERARERVALMRAIQNRGLLSAGEADSIVALRELSDRAVEAIHAFVAATTSAVMMVQVEDAVGVRTQINLPGTVEEHPNWRRKLPLTLDQLATDPRLLRVAEVIARERPTHRR